MAHHTSPLVSRILLALGISVAGVLVASDATRPPSPQQPAPSFPPPFTGGPLFPRPLTYTAPGAVQIVVADWNGDGVADLAIPGKGGRNNSGVTTNGEISLFLARGDGTFARQPNITSPTLPVAGVAADFNGDTKPDLILADQQGFTLTVYPGNGSGGFGAPVTTAVAQKISALAAADLDGDDRIDVVAAHAATNQVGVLRGLGDAHFEAESLYSTCEAPVDLALGDLDGDADLDLAVACAGSYCTTPECSDPGGAVGVHVNPGNGALGPAQIVAAGRHFGSVAIGDLLADGHPDIVASTVLNGGGLTPGVDFIDGHGATGFAAAVAIDTGAPTNDLTIVDMNGDGRPEVAGVADPYNRDSLTLRQIRIWMVAPGGGFTLVEDRATSLGMARLAAGGFNRDGFPDLVIADDFSFDDGPLETYLGRGDGRLVVEDCVAAGYDVSSLALRDLNHDGLMDILALEGVTFDVYVSGFKVLLAQQNGTYVESDYALPYVDEPSMLVADLTGDGESDVAVLLGTPNHEVRVFRGVGDGTFAPPVVLWTSPWPIAMAAGRFDGDDIADLAILTGTANAGGNQNLIAFFRGRPDGVFEGPHYAYPAMFDFRLIAAGDFDADGTDEIVVTPAFSGCCGLNRYRVEPDWSLTRLQVLFSPGGSVSSVETLDLNGDSVDDLRFGQGSLLGHPGTGLDGSAPFSVGSGGFTVGDLNGDGVPDPVSTTYFGLYAQLSNGAGGFTVPAEFLRFGSLTTHSELAADDMNGDGRTDVVYSGQGVCIAHNLAGVPDIDHDGLSDSTDPCIDPDDDGHADRLTPTTTCPPDNCVGVANVSQSDADQDGVGDACDVCPFDAAGDPDHDGVCDTVDLCRGVDDASNADHDGDRVGDACDVCPSTADPGQADADHDGSGDACQPSAALAVIQDGGPIVEAQVGVSDPQHETLTATLRLTGPARTWKTLNVLAGGGDLCSREFSILPPDIQGPGGIAFGYDPGPGGNRVIADSDPFLNCDDGNPDYLMARGPCAKITSSFDLSLDFDSYQATHPITICIARYPNVVGFLDLELFNLDATGVDVREAFRQTIISMALPPAIATSIPLAGLTPGVTYAVELEVTDGNTHPVKRSRDFVYHGETTLEVTADADHDGLIDGDDPCVDQDADGFRDPAYAGTCAPDNCPLLSNPGQEDADADAIGDVCDPCTDRDGDGGGDAGFPANTCAVDNCPIIFNLGQADADGDLIGDACDICTDSDQDGFGDAAIPPSVCPVDNCRLVANPDQADVDADLIGDACDNCPAATNPHQEDENTDGSGDACQPRVAIDGVAADGSGNLLASGRLSDPQGETLHGTVSVAGNGIAPFTLHDAFVTSDCSLGYLPEGIPNKGIGFANGSIGVPALFDLSFGMSCGDGLPDYRLAPGSCGAPTSAFDTSLILSASALPMAFCVRAYAASSGGQTLFVDSFDQDTIQIQGTGVEPILTTPFSGQLPDAIALAALYPGATYTLHIEVSDGNTLPRSASAGFPYLGEASMLFAFNSGPRASIVTVASTECSGPDGAQATLDGSGSTDPDSSPGTADDIASYDWYEDYGTAAERHLGSGAVLLATLGLGSHAVTLKVTDLSGASGTVATTVAVVDTAGPVVDCLTTTPAAECSGAGGAYVTVGATAHDLCGGSVTLANDHTTGGADASGAYPLGGTNVVFTGTDARGLTATCTTAVSVVDTQPPTLSLLTDPSTLWPPNHEMVLVNVRFAAQDLCGAGVRVELVSVTSSEPDDAAGGDDGQTTGDIQHADVGAADASIDLRAERGGKGSGRTYTLTYRAVDLAGHATTAIGIVAVPHDQGQGPEPLQMRLEHAGTGHEARLYWPAVTGATAYDVIRGDLASLRASGGVLHLGTVAVLARATASTSALEPATIESALPGAPPLSATPPLGHGYFYLIQQTTDRGAVGYGTESAPWPRVPDACDGGCPGTTETVATSPAGSGSGGSGIRKR